MRDLVRTLVLVSLVVLIGLASGCANSSSDLLGKWSGLHVEPYPSEEMWSLDAEFFENGRCTIQGRSGEYWVEDDERVVADVNGQAVYFRLQSTDELDFYGDGSEVLLTLTRE